MRAVKTGVLWEGWWWLASGNESYVNIARQYRPLYPNYPNPRPDLFHAYGANDDPATCRDDPRAAVDRLPVHPGHPRRHGGPPGLLQRPRPTDAPGPGRGDGTDR